MRLAQLFLLSLAVCLPSRSQQPLSVHSQSEMSHFFEKTSDEASLDCHLDSMKPFLDFSFRFEIGFIVRCRLSQFQGNAAQLGMVLRITPLHGNPVILGQSYAIPAAPPELSERVNLKHLHSEIQFSGVYAAGEGAYENEIVVLDRQNRSFHKKWHVRTEGWAAGEDSPMSLAPLQVEAISLPRWSGPSADGRGLHLTVFVDAAPLSRRSTRLRAWDRAFVLGAVSSVLRGQAVASVRLIAFNLDQQIEVYRDAGFTSLGMTSLSEALSKLELATISYRTLQNDQGAAELLDSLIQEECTRPHPSDAVVFLGPRRFNEIPFANRPVSAGRLPPLFYFEYAPRAMADSANNMERLTHSLHGHVFHLYSPEDLAEALTKMRKALDSSH